MKRYEDSYRISLPQRPHNQLQGLNGKQMQDKLFVEKGINWNDLPVWQKRGVCIIKQYYKKENAARSKWDVDLDTPIFTQNRDYINQYVFLDKDEN